MIASLIRLVVALCCIATGYPATADTHMYSRSKYDSLYIVHHGCVCVFSVLIFCQSRSRHVAEYSFAFLHETWFAVMDLHSGAELVMTVMSACLVPFTSSPCFPSVRAVKSWMRVRLCYDSVHYFVREREREREREKKMTIFFFLLNAICPTSWGNQ